MITWPVLVRKKLLDQETPLVYCYQEGEDTLVKLQAVIPHDIPRFNLLNFLMLLFGIRKKKQKVLNPCVPLFDVGDVIEIECEGTCSAYRIFHIEYIPPFLPPSGYLEGVSKTGWHGFRFLIEGIS